MENLINNALNISKLIIKAVVKHGDYVVDATLGNGHDTVFLAELVGEKGCVYAFDIQKEAIARSNKTIPKNLKSRIKMIHASHEDMQKHIKKPVKLILFNLGYLPGAKHDICTQAQSTVNAVKNSLQILDKNGIIILVCYRGHEQGKNEWLALCDYIAYLDQNSYNTAITDFPNQKNNPPALICIQKRK